MNYIRKIARWAGIIFRCLKFGYIPGNNSISLHASISKGLKLTLGRGARIREYVQLQGGGSGVVTIGENSNVGPFVMLEAQPGGSITIGSGCGINAFCVIYGGGGVTIGDNTRIACHVVIVANNHNIDDVSKNIRDQGFTAEGIRVGSDVWIGAGARILDGVHIGDHAVIGAGAVVTKDIPEYAVAVGVPARVLRLRGEEKKI